MTDLARLARPGAPAFRVAAFVTFTLLAGCNGNELTNASNTATDSSSAPAQPDSASSAVKAHGPQRNTLTSVTVSPNTDSVASGAGVAYKAMGTKSDGSQVSVPVKWTATGGTIDSTGYFRAGSAPGRFQVVGSEPTSGLKDTAVVTVTASTLFAITATGSCTAVGGGRQVNVATVSALRSALSGARPGDAIRLADGVYSGQFVITPSGTAAAPISLCGSRQAVLDGVNLSTGLTLQLTASYWRLRGFTITRGQKGLFIRGGHFNVVDSLWVHDVGMEAIHLLGLSTHNTVQNSLVERTGRSTVTYGEGIYLGSAGGNWCSYSACNPDKSDSNVVRGNTIRQTTAEGMELKEGTTGEVVTSNYFADTGPGMQSGNQTAFAFIAVRGNGATVSNNTGVRSARSGLQVYLSSGMPYDNWGHRNSFHGNSWNVQNTGTGFSISSRPDNTVGCDNSVINATAGFSSIGCK